MGKKKFITMIRKVKDKDSNEIIRAFMGIGYGVSKKGDKQYHRFVTDSDGVTFMVMEFTKKQYQRFCEIVEGLYPGLCDFNI